MNDNIIEKRRQLKAEITFSKKALSENLENFPFFDDDSSNYGFLENTKKVASFLPLTLLTALFPKSIVWKTILKLIKL